MDLDTGNPAAATDDGPGQALEQGEVDRRVERLGFEGGEASADFGQLVPHRVQVLQPFVETEILPAVAPHCEPQEGRPLLIEAQISNVFG